MNAGFSPCAGFWFILKSYPVKIPHAFGLDKVGLNWSFFFSRKGAGIKAVIPVNGFVDGFRSHFSIIPPLFGLSNQNCITFKRFLLSGLEQNLKKLRELILSVSGLVPKKKCLLRPYQRKPEFTTRMALLWGIVG